MTTSLNRATLIGNVGADPEIKTLSSGKPVANLRLATAEKWTDKSSGEAKERTSWHSIVCWNEGLCKVIEQYVRKGTKLLIEGSIQSRKYQDQSGADKWVTEIVLQGFECRLMILGGGPSQDKAAAPAPAASSGGLKKLDDEIPF